MAEGDCKLQPATCSLQARVRKMARSVHSIPWGPPGHLGPGCTRGLAPGVLREQRHPVVRPRPPSNLYNL